MELDGRKKTILTAIIQTYLATGEPVGSRTISKYTDLNLSSATIRNEMSDLEEICLLYTSIAAVPDCFIGHGSVDWQRKQTGLDADSILERIDKLRERQENRK